MVPTFSDDYHSALSRGAEIGLARAMVQTSDSRTVGQFIERKLGALSSSEQNVIKKLAESILEAATYVSGLEPDEDIDEDQIPTNPELFGEDWGGKRLFWFGEWQIPGTDEWYRFSGTLPDITSYPDITVYAANLASSYIEAYPDKFVGPDGTTPETVTVRILGIEKAF